MESSLAVTRTYLKDRVAIFLGWPRGPKFEERAPTARQDAQLDDCVNSGVSQVYEPPPLDGPVPYVWSFLRPILSLTLATGMQSVALPDDFGGLEGHFRCQGTAQTTVPWIIELYSDAAILDQYARTPSATGPPQMVGLTPLKGTTSLASSRYQLLVYPQADAEYTLQSQYYIIGEALTERNPYVYGAALHRELYIESCLAIAEQRIDDQIDGPHTLKFKERLAAAIGSDRRNKAQTTGHNGDRSDERWGRYNPHWNFHCLYNGAGFD